MKRLVRPTLVLVAALSGSSVTTSALACDRSPDLMPIPGATDAEHDARYKAYEQARDVIFAFELEKSAIENSGRVYLAKVDAVAPNPAKSGVRTLSVKPVWQVRGMLPAEPAVLEEEPLTSCPSPGGLWGSKRGDLVVVFDKPGSKTGWRAGEVRSGELIDAIDMYALSLEKKKVR